MEFCEANPESSFGNLKELEAFLAGRQKQVLIIPANEVSLDEKGIFRTGRFEGPLTKPGLEGLLRVLEIPWGYGTDICPPDLLATNVERLCRVKWKVLRIHTIDNRVTAVMPAERSPIEHDVLIDHIGSDRPIEEAIVSDGHLRITAINKKSGQVLPGDVFGYGWELQNDENGWLPIEARSYITRLICSNGLLGFDNTATFTRSSTSKEDIHKSLRELSAVLDRMPQIGWLEDAAKWASEEQVGNQLEAVMGYLAKRLEGKATRLALEGITANTSWYDILNLVTSTARAHELSMRRRYEFEGGALLSWFSSRGRRRAPWSRRSCETCEYWPVE